MIMDLKQTCVLYIVDFMHVLMYDAKLRIIQSYEQVLVPMGSDKRGPTVHLCPVEFRLLLAPLAPFPCS